MSRARYMLTAPESDLADWRAAAERQDLTLAQWMRRACAERLARAKGGK